MFLFRQPRGPVLADLDGGITCERPPVFSVTSETAANLSVANAPARSARADQSPAPDSFSALIDGNAADTAANDRPAAPDRPSPQLLRARPRTPLRRTRNRAPVKPLPPMAAPMQQASPQSPELQSRAL